MKDRHLVIVEGVSDYPSCAEGGLWDTGTRATWYVALETHRDTDFWTSLAMCGAEFSRVSSNVELTVDQVMYMLSRLRGGGYAEPNTSKICMWLDKYTKGAILGIGGHSYTVNPGESFDRGDLLQWIDVMLQEEFG